ncbi:MAG: hypothetical protein PUH54_06010 [Oscillospiraceae bacterium]|nr:hypothetical protein [Oscillospiraceae bacterium]
MSEFNESVSGVEPVKKKGKAPVIAGITAGVVAVVAGGSVIAYNTSAFVKNKVKLATLSPKEYYAWVNDVNTSEQIEYLSKSYDKYVDIMGKDSGKGINSKMDVTYTMSDGLKTLVKNAMGGTDKANKFVDNINNISLTLDESVFQGIIGCNLGLDFNENDIADLEMSIDYANLFMLGRVPQITERYLGMDLSASASSDEDAKALEIVGKFYSDPEEILTKDEFRKLAEKYTSLWNECVSEVQQEKGEEVTVGKYTNEYTVLTVEMNEEFLENTAEKYINALKEDETVKNIIVTRLAVCDEETYISDLDNALEDIKSDEDGEDDDLILTLKTYVDPTGEIRGYTLKDSQDDGFELLFTGESEQTANGIFSFTNSEEDMSVKGNIDYTVNDDKYTGSVDMTVTEYDEDTKILVEFTDLETVNKDYGYVNGNVNFSVNDSAPFAIALNSDGSSQKASFDIDIEDVNYGNIVLEISSSEISELSVPDKSGAYIIDENTDSLEGYATEEELINFISSVVKNTGFAETDEEARAIVKSYLYGYSSPSSTYSSSDYNSNFDDIIY